jgi:NitT/TauT family transport system permease protein
MTRVVERLPPILIGLAFLAAWEIAVRALDVPPYILPGPLLILQTLWAEAPLLLCSLWTTLEITFAALALAVGGGVALAFLMTLSSWLERSLYPYAVIAQVTPIIAVAPLIILWIDNAFLALVVCATIVAFFPILSNTIAGFRSADRNLHDLFRLYGARRWQVQSLLEAPSALPYFLAGLRISGGLALIGAVAAEFVAGTGGTETGLAYRILEAGYRLQIPRLFAALMLLSLAGIAIHAVLGALSGYVLRRWYGEDRSS